MNIFKKEKTNPEIQEKDAKSSHFKMIIFLCLFILAAIGIIVGYIYAQRPAQGIVKGISKNQDAENKNNDIPEAFTGKYISFLYGNSYVLKSHDIASVEGAVILEQAFLVETSAVSKKIALTVRSLPTHNLEDCPDFKMRAMNSKGYKKEDFNFGAISGASFETADQGAFEKTFFLLHGDYLAIIAITAPALVDEKLENEASSIVKSVSWLK
jgi:hypothetical protein